MAAAVWRIRDRATFAELRRRGRRGRTGDLGATWLPAAAGRPRLAMAVGREVGSAVERNRVRRRLRAVFAGLAPELPAGAYLLRVGPGVASSEPRALEHHVRTAIEDALAAPERR